MNLNKITELFKTKKPVIGMVHLGPLPGDWNYNSQEDYSETIEKALCDAKTLEECGVHGFIIETAGSSPFYIGDQVDAMSVACTAHIATIISQNISIPFGINVCTNAVKQSIAICKATGAKFVRSTGWANGYFATNGFVKPVYSDALRYKKTFDAEGVLILADVKVKNGSHFIFSDKTTKEMVGDVFSTNADAAIVTGASTGIEPNIEELKELRDSSKGPIIMGSGATTNNLEVFADYVDGFIVGTHFKEGNNMKNPVSAVKVKEFMDKWKKIMEGSE